MRVYTHNKTIVCLKNFRFCQAHYILLLGLQHEVPNLLVEIEPTTYPTRQDELHQFVPVHSLDLEKFQALSLLNA